MDDGRFTFRRLDLTELCEVYKTHTLGDFPKNERVSLLSIKKLYAQGMYEPWGAFLDGALKAYAFLMRVDGIKGVLLDYFAVDTSLRNCGIGSLFLKELKNLVDCDGIIIESETPDRAKNSDDRKVREKRLSFYLKNGAVLSDCEWHVFGAAYRLFWLPVKTPLDQIKIEESIRLLYLNSALPKFALIKSMSCKKLLPCL